MPHCDPPQCVALPSLQRLLLGRWEFLDRKVFIPRFSHLKMGPAQKKKAEKNTRNVLDIHNLATGFSQVNIIHSSLVNFGVRIFLDLHVFLKGNTPLPKLFGSRNSMVHDSVHENNI